MYSERQEIVFDMIDAMGFEKEKTVSVTIDPEYFTIELKGDEPGERITHRLPMRENNA